MLVRTLITLTLAFASPLLAVDSRIEAWRRSGDAEALQRYLESRTRMDRDAGYALDALRRLGTRESFDKLVQLLEQNPWPGAAYQAGRRLRQMGQFQPEAALLNAYVVAQEAETSERRRMLRLLNGFETPGIFAIYEGILRDKRADEELKQISIEGLASFDSPATKALLLDVYNQASSTRLEIAAAKALVSFEDPQLWRGLFGPILQFPDQPISRAQLEALASLQSPQAAPLLQQLWDVAKHADLKEAVVQAALRTRSGAVQALLEQAYFAYSNQMQRQGFVTQLSRFPIDQPGDFFLRLLESEEDERLAAHLISQLARSPHPDALPMLIKWMNQGARHTQLMCIRSLAALGQPEAAAPLAEFMRQFLKTSDTVEEIKVHVDNSRERFVEAFFDAIEACNPLEGLGVARYVVDEGVASRQLATELQLRIRAIELLQRSADPAQGTFLLEHKLHLYPSVPLRIAAIRALGTLAPEGASKALIPLLKHEVPAVRWHSARSLGLLQDKAAIDALSEAADASHPELAEQARYSLDQLQ